MMLLFLLPFVSVSCERAESETLTGVELLQDKNPQLHGDLTASNAANIRDSVHNHAMAARLVFLALVVAFIAAVFVWWFNASASVSLAFQFVTLLTLGSMGAFLAAGMRPSGVDPHHKIGLLLLPPLALVQVLVAYNILSQRLQGERRLGGWDLALPLTAVCLFGISAAIPPAALLCAPFFVVCVGSLWNSPTLFRLAAAILSLMPISLMTMFLI